MSPASRTDLRRARRAIDDLLVAVDRADAMLTVPTERVSRRWVAGTTIRAAVEPVLWEQHVRYARRRDPDVLAALVERYRPNARAHARRHYRHGEPVDDLTQVAYEALVQALQRFDPTRGIPFLAFANPTIVGSLRRHVRDTGWTIRVPRRVHELATPVRDAIELLSHDLGRRPTIGEIADVLGIDEREIRDAMAAEEARSPSSLDAPDAASGLLSDQVIGRADRGFTVIDNRTSLLQSLERVSDEDRALLQMYFGDERSQSEIAEVLGCSQMQVSRLLRKAIHRLRRLMVEP